MTARWLEVLYNDGRDPVKVRIGPKAEVAFERHFKLTMSTAAKDISAEHLYYLAWVSLHSAGKEALDFDSFLDVLEEVETVVGDALNPTQPEPESGQSSS